MPAVAQRVAKLPPYLFARIEELIAAKKKSGVDVISLGIGDPDQPTPEHICDEARQQILIAENHQYPSSKGMLSYCQAVAGWYKRRFGVQLDPGIEVVSLIGSRGHCPYCLVLCESGR